MATWSPTSLGPCLADARGVAATLANREGRQRSVEFRPASVRPFASSRPARAGRPGAERQGRAGRTLGGGRGGPAGPPLESGTVSITSTILRVKGVGLVRKRTKSRAGERVLQLPRWAIDMLLRRFMEGPRLDEPVFPDSDGGWRDPSNTSRALRQARGSAGFSWVTTHVFRKTAATILDEAGFSARVVADQLGHSR